MHISRTSLHAIPAAHRIPIISALLLALSCIAAFWLLRDGAAGNEWKQGDWLINTGGGMVRRGLAGDALLAFSDLLGIRPSALVAALQLAALPLCLLGPLAFAVRRGQDARMALLYFSPALLLWMWAADPLALRKEQLGIAALSLLVLAGIDRPRARGWAAAATALIGFGAIAHEVVAMMAPVAMLALWILHRGGALGAGAAAGMGGAMAMAAGAAWLIAVAWPEPASTAQVCAALIERGEGAHMCEGAIAWLTPEAVIAHPTAADAAGRFERMLRFGPGMQFLANFAVSLAAPVCFALLMNRRWEAMALGALCVALFLPLHVVAIDSGRWLGLQISSFVLLAMLLVETGRWRPVRRAPRALTWALAAVPLVWGVGHLKEVLPGGVFAALAQAAAGV